MIKKACTQKKSCSDGFSWFNKMNSMSLKDILLYCSTVHSSSNLQGRNLKVCYICYICRKDCQDHGAFVLLIPVIRQEYCRISSLSQDVGYVAQQ